MNKYLISFILAFLASISSLHAKDTSRYGLDLRLRAPVVIEHFSIIPPGF